MSLSDTSQQLQSSMTTILNTWESSYGGSSEPMYWLLRAQEAEIAGLAVSSVLDSIEASAVRETMNEQVKASSEYWADVRYASLEPVTMLWGTIVNCLRVAAQTGRATDKQRVVFPFSPKTVLAFFQSAWDNPTIADDLYHVFRAMPAPECQAMAALLNVHVDAVLDENVMCRLVRLLDHEGPMSEEELQDLTAFSNTHLVRATFRGMRGSA